MHSTMKSKTKKKISKREAFDNKVHIIIFGIEWLVYLGFCLLAKETFMGQTLKPITELPTVVICMNDGTWHFYKHLKLIYRVDGGGEKQLMT